MLSGFVGILAMAGKDFDGFSNVIKIAKDSVGKYGISRIRFPKNPAYPYANPYTTLRYAMNTLISSKIVHILIRIRARTGYAEFGVSVFYETLAIRIIIDYIQTMKIYSIRIPESDTLFGRF